MPASDSPIPPHHLLAISAAIAATLGRSARIASIHFDHDDDTASPRQPPRRESQVVPLRITPPSTPSCT
jgi:hypothetical protein